MEKVLLFYKYVSIIYPEQMRKWQHRLCTELGLKGRIIVATEGINATVGGTIEALEQYKKSMEAHELFKDIDFKESQGSIHDFPRLRVVVKEEIVRMGISPVALPAHEAGQHLSPAQAHNLLQNKSDDLVILDGRNHYEARIGAFEGAITPPINTFREFPAYIDQHADMLKDKTVLMYCTGGIRCERASAYVKSKGVAKKVLQITGGIHRYVEQFPDGFFKGKNYIFDARTALKVTDDILGTCDHCNIPFDDYTNCINAMCNKQILSCSDCLKKLKNTCSNRCSELVQSGSVVIRTKFIKHQPPFSQPTHE